MSVTPVCIRRHAIQHAGLCNRTLPLHSSYEADRSSGNMHRGHPRAGADVLDVCDRRGQRSELIVLVHQRSQESLILSFQYFSITLHGIDKEVRCLIHPFRGLPENRHGMLSRCQLGSHQLLENGAFVGKSLVCPTRAIELERSWRRSLRCHPPESRDGRLPSVSALRPARHKPRMASASSSVRSFNARSIGHTPRTPSAVLLSHTDQQQHIGWQLHVENEPGTVEKACLGGRLLLHFGESVVQHHLFDRDRLLPAQPR